ncbi:MAG: flagellar hook-length control protein FliK [Paracoccaceae bacterium]
MTQILMLSVPQLAGATAPPPGDLVPDMAHLAEFAALMTPALAGDLSGAIPLPAPNLAADGAPVSVAETALPTLVALPPDRPMLPEATPAAPEESEDPEPPPDSQPPQGAELAEPPEGDVVLPAMALPDIALPVPLSALPVEVPAAEPKAAPRPAISPGPVPAAPMAMAAKGQPPAGPILVPDRADIPSFPQEQRLFPVLMPDPPPPEVRASGRPDPAVPPAVPLAVLPDRQPAALRPDTVATAPVATAPEDPSVAAAAPPAPDRNLPAPNPPRPALADEKGALTPAAPTSPPGQGDPPADPPGQGRAAQDGPLPPAAAQGGDGGNRLGRDLPGQAVSRGNAAAAPSVPSKGERIGRALWPMAEPVVAAAGNNGDTAEPPAPLGALPPVPPGAGPGKDDPLPDPPPEAPPEPARAAQAVDATIARGQTDGPAPVALTPAAPPSAAPIRPDPPAAAAAPAPPLPDQVLQAVATATGPVTELRLAPEELGAIRIDLRNEGERLSITISAERPETLDLLRRHSDQLLGDLRQSGNQSLDLGFGRWSGPPPQSPAATTDPDPAPDLPPPQVLPPPPPAAGYPAAALFLRI